MTTAAHGPVAPGDEARLTRPDASGDEDRTAHAGDVQTGWSARDVAGRELPAVRARARPAGRGMGPHQGRSLEWGAVEPLGVDGSVRHRVGAAPTISDEGCARVSTRATSRGHELELPHKPTLSMS